MKKWLKSFSTLLLLFSIIFPALENTVVRAEVNNNVIQLTDEVQNSITDSTLNTTIDKNSLSDSIKDFRKVSVHVYTEDPQVNSENINSYIEEGTSYDEVNGITTDLSSVNNEDQAYVLTILYSESHTPLAYHLETISLENNTTATSGPQLQLSEDSITLSPGESSEIKVTYTDENGKSSDVTLDPELSITNDDDEFATFEDGQLTAGEEPGSEEITFSYKDTTAVLSVTIEEANELVSIQINPKEFKLAVGKTYSLKVFGIYSDGTKEELTDELNWQSSNTSVATVKDGVVTGVKEGKNNVIITVSYGDFSAKTEGKIFVQAAPKLKGLYTTKSALKLKQGDKETVKIYAVYSDKTRKDITKNVKWTVAKSSIASISNGQVVANAAGSTRIIAAFQKYSTNINVVVQKKANEKQNKNDRDKEKEGKDDDHSKNKGKK